MKQWIKIDSKEKKYNQHQIKHIPQRYDWDCGVTCVMMLLSDHQQTELRDNLEQICAEEGFGHSTWTIDLCYLLKRYGIEHCMYTTRCGVDEGHRRHGYYRKIMDHDAERVRRRFAAAAGAGLRVVERALGAREVAAHVARAGPAILLTDAALLACHLCKRNKLKSEFRKVFGGAYRGHYVLATGVGGAGVGGAGVGGAGGAGVGGAGVGGAGGAGVGGAGVGGAGGAGVGGAGVGGAGGAGVGGAGVGGAGVGGAGGAGVGGAGVGGAGGAGVGGAGVGGAGGAGVGGAGVGGAGVGGAGGAGVGGAGVGGAGGAGVGGAGVGGAGGAGVGGAGVGGAGGAGVGRLVYCDPAARAARCAATPRSLRGARLAPGTDQDVILVYNHYR